MCGIIGYIGSREAVPVLMEGLSRLEYRGYDSAGLAFLSEGTIAVRKEKGKLENLQRLMEGEHPASHLGIGHTRWATHGEPSARNAHPHLSQNGSLAVIHNGIIENYREIKEWLIEEKGVTFSSQTDSEVIAHLLEHYYQKERDLLSALRQTTERMEGAYAVSVLAKDEPHRLYAARKDSPLIVGYGEGENFLASDVPALMRHTRDVYYVENGEFVVLEKEKVKIYNSFLQEMKRESTRFEWDLESAEKEGYEHFTLKEIHEQPKVLGQILHRRIKADELQLDVRYTKQDLDSINRIYLVGCGSAYHAGLLGKKWLERFTGIPVITEIASELRYGDYFLDEQSLFIAISQSGETIDTLQALRKAKECGAKTLSILNVLGSSMARESDATHYIGAGPEIGVASTKAYAAQLLALALLGLHMGQVLGRVAQEELLEHYDALRKLPELAQKILEQDHLIKELSYAYFHSENIFFIGRGVDYVSALEASLKLKELSYINSFAIAAGELKHGTIALVEPGTLVIAFATQSGLFDKTISNIQEVKARGAYVLAITADDEKEGDVADVQLRLPIGSELFAPLLTIIPAQLLAYYFSLARGNDVDKPRNLAKSVTVE